jgi:ribose transport system substrate-binding protein
MNTIAKLFFAFALVLLNGCGKQEAASNSNTGSSQAGGKKLLGITVMTLANPFFVELTNAAKEEAEKHGYEVIILSGDDADKQSKQMHDFISQKADAIIVAPKDTLAIGEPIKAANKAGIPVFTADTGCSDTSAKVVCNVTTDNFGGGKLAAKAMIQGLPNGGKVLILDYKKAQSCILRVDGFKDVIAAHNKANPDKAIEIVAELDGAASEEPSKKATEDQLNSNPDLKGIFAINDPSALGAVVALKKANKLNNIKVIGFDGQLIGKQAILKGEIYADPIQFPKEIGKLTVQQMLKYKNGDEVQKEILIDTKLYFQADAQNDPNLTKAL